MGELLREVVPHREVPGFDKARIRDKGRAEGIGRAVQGGGAT